MARDDKIRLPSSMGGLMSYQDDLKTKWEFNPGTVVIITVVVMILAIIFNAYGKALFGL